jgi:hypothetical protein
MTRSLKGRRTRSKDLTTLLWPPLSWKRWQNLALSGSTFKSTSMLMPEFGAKRPRVLFLREEENFNRHVDGRVRHEAPLAYSHRNRRRINAAW